MELQQFVELLLTFIYTNRHKKSLQSWRGPLQLCNRLSNGLHSEVNFPHFGHWFTDSEVDPCQTAAVQIVDGSDLRAHADLQERPVSGSGDVCWLTAVPKLASWQLCCWGLSVLTGHGFDPDPTCLTSWQDFCSEQQYWHWHTYRRQTHTRLADWQIFHHPVQWECFGVLYSTRTTGLLWGTAG